MRDGWDRALASLGEAGYVDGEAAHNAVLLRAARARWEARVDVRTSMHSLLFTPYGDEYPFRDLVRVSWEDGVHTFVLRVDDHVVSGDRCRPENAPAVLDAFLSQLPERARTHSWWFARSQRSPWRPWRSRQTP